MDVSSFFASKGILVAKDALEYILSKEDPLAYAMQIVERHPDKKFLNLDDVKTEPSKVDLVKKEDGDEEIEVFFPTDFKPVAKDIDPQIEIFDDLDVTGKSESDGGINDFIEYFRDRFQRIARILGERGPTVRNIEVLKRNRYRERVRIIGMVTEKRYSRNGHLLIIIEDLTDQLTVLVPKDDRVLMAKGANLVHDEVIAVDGSFSRGDLFIAKDIIQPDVIPKPVKTAKDDVALAMISDTHVGSNLFLEKTFVKFLDWLKGRGPRKDLAGKVKYLTIAGDLVDGIGIYPGQEQELSITDIYEQYAAFERFMEEIPDYIEVFIIPGNHDAVRVADPQPAIPDDLLPTLYSFDNFHMLGSPGYVSVHGIEVLMYHGQSIHSYVPNISGFDYTKPERLGIEALKRRHIHAIYGDKPPIAPEKRDYLVIERVPDIMHFGDVHKNGYANYKGVTIVNSGTWQDITPYQIKQGHHPTPGILPVITLRDRKINILKFRRGEGIGSTSLS